MFITGYRPASKRDSTGHRINGWRVYGLSQADGIFGSLPVCVFVANKDFPLDFPSLDSLIGKKVVVRKDHLDRLAEFRVVDYNTKG